MADAETQALMAKLRAVIGDLQGAEKFGLPFGTECSMDAVGRDTKCLICNACWGCHMTWECPTERQMQSTTWNCRESCRRIFRGEKG